MWLPLPQLIAWYDALLQMAALFQDYRDQMEVNFFGAVAMSKAFVPLLAATAARRPKAERPSLVMVNSFVGRMPANNMPAYTASKFALCGFTDSIRREVQDLGIHVAQVHPGETLPA